MAYHLSVSSLWGFYNVVTYNPSGLGLTHNRIQVYGVFMAGLFLGKDTKAKAGSSYTEKHLVVGLLIISEASPNSQRVKRGRELGLA